jgi:hypothetical protein
MRIAAGRALESCGDGFGIVEHIVLGLIRDAPR